MTTVSKMIKLHKMNMLGGPTVIIRSTMTTLTTITMVPMTKSAYGNQCPQWPCYGVHHAHDQGAHKKQWHVWHAAHSQLCLKNKSTQEIPNKKTIQYLTITVVMDHVICSVIKVFWLWSNVPPCEHIVLHFQSQSLLSWFLHLNIDTSVF